MKFRFGLMAAAAFAFLLAGTGCADNKVTAERESLMSQNKELMEKLDAERRARSDAEARASAMGGQMATTPPTSPDSATPPTMASELDLSNSIRPATGGARGGRSTTPASSGGSSSSANGDVVMEISGDVLFDSGKATVKAAAHKTLDGIASTLKSKYSGQKIRVEGHTDASPVRGSGWDNNWDLGAARATAVMLYLEKQGVKNMYIASFAATEPKSSKTPAQNRRVDIVVVRR